MIDIYPLKMVIFHSYVSLPKGNEQQIWCWTSCVFQGFGVDPSCLSLLFRQLMSWWRWNFVSQLTHVLQTVWDTAGLLLGNSWSMLKYVEVCWSDENIQISNMFQLFNTFHVRPRPTYLKTWSANDRIGQVPKAFQHRNPVPQSPTPSDFLGSVSQTRPYNCETSSTLTRASALWGLISTQQFLIIFANEHLKNIERNGFEWMDFGKFTWTPPQTSIRRDPKSESLWLSSLWSSSSSR